MNIIYLNGCMWSIYSYSSRLLTTIVQNKVQTGCILFICAVIIPAQLDNHRPGILNIKELLTMIKLMTTCKPYQTTHVIIRSSSDFGYGNGYKCTSIVSHVTWIIAVTILFQTVLWQHEKMRSIFCHMWIHSYPLCCSERWLSYWVHGMYK